MPNYEGIAFKVIISKNFDGVVFKTVMLSGAKIMDSQINAESTWSSEHLVKLFPKGEASGSIASFEDGAGDVPLISCVVDFMAKQESGTPTPSAPIPIVGVDKVNITRCGKNLLPSLSSAVTVNQITFSPLSDGAIDIDGTASGNASVDVGRNEGCFLQAGTYFVNITATPYTITVFGIVNGTVTTIKNGGGLFTLTKPTQIFVRVFIASGTTVNHLRLPLQLELGSTATAYEPYNGTTALINLGGTYYGGSVDAVMGKITLTHGALIPTGSDFSIYSSGIFYCDIPSNYQGDNYRFSTLGSHFKRYEGGWGGMPDQNFQAYNRLGIRYDAYTTKEDFQNWVDGQISANTPLVFVFPLATPIVVYASNTAELYTKAGLNNIFCDTGDVDVQYFLDIKKYIDNLVNPSNTRSLSTGLNLTREAPSMPDEVEEEEEEAQETNEER